MRKTITTTIMLAISAFGFAACSSDSNRATQSGSNDDGQTTEFEIQYTQAVPSEYFQTAQQQGKVEVLR